MLALFIGLGFVRLTSPPPPLILRSPRAIGITYFRLLGWPTAVQRYDGRFDFVGSLSPNLDSPIEFSAHGEHSVAPLLPSQAHGSSSVPIELACA